MNASWADPVGVETFPRGTAHLATQRYPPLPGDAPAKFKFRPRMIFQPYASLMPASI